MNLDTQDSKPPNFNNDHSCATPKSYWVFLNLDNSTFDPPMIVDKPSMKKNPP